MAALGLHCCTQVFLQWGKRELLSSCGAWASHCRSLSFYRPQTKRHASFSSCGAWAQQLWLPALEHWLNSCGMRLSCPVAYGIILDWGWNLCLLHWQVNSYLLLYHGSPEKAFLILNDGRLHQNLFFVQNFSFDDFPGGSDGKASAYNAGDPGSIPGLGRSPGEGNGTHSSTLAWKIPWMKEPGRLQPMGLQRVGHN